MARTIRLLRDSFPDEPALDIAVSRALLLRVAEWVEPETLRLHRPGPIVAFGRLDRLAPGYPVAVAEARARGFAVVERLAGGRAAVFHPGTIAFSWTIPDPWPGQHITARFREVAAIMADAFVSLGVDARVGEVAGEYCPGAWSVNARGRTKLMGVGQRLVAGAAHVGGVVVVHGSQEIRDVLAPVYRALGLAWDPATTGSLEDEIGPVGWEVVERAVLRRFALDYDLVDGTLSDQTVARGREIASEHVPAV